MGQSANWYEVNYTTDPIEHRPDLVMLAEDQARWIIDLLQLKPGDNLLDLCGGKGRLAIPLARRGLNVTVLDLSEALLESGRAIAKSQGLNNIEWLRANMLDIPRAGYDAIINVFTSFGYFDEESANDSVLGAVRAALRKRGRFLIDLTNRDMRALNQRPRTWKKMGDVTILEEHSFDLSRSRWLVTRETISTQQGITDREVHTYNIRVYSPHEIRQKLEAAGMKVIAQYGRISGIPLTPHSWRHVTIAEAS